MTDEQILLSLTNEDREEELKLLRMLVAELGDVDIRLIFDRIIRTMLVDGRRAELRSQQEGAAIVLGIIGMAEAIRARYVQCPFCKDLDTHREGVYWVCARNRHSFQPGGHAWM